MMETTYANGYATGTVPVLHVDGVLMTAAMRKAWQPLRDAAAADGVTLRPSSGFRTMAEQQELWDRHVAGTLTTPVARPGHSRHQNGLALDIHVGGNSTDSPEFRWLHLHAQRYGWRNVGATFNPPEWWHWEIQG